MVRLVGGFTLLLAVLAASVAQAQTYPTKPVRAITGTPPGAAPDLIGRVIGKELERQLGQPFIVENRVGASSTIAGKAVASAAPDGHTLFFGSATSISPVFVKNNGVDATKELAAVSNIFTAPYVFFLSAKQPFKSFQEVVAYSKANPGKVNFGTPAALINLLMNVLKSRYSMQYTTIPYKGTPDVIRAMNSGDVDFTILTPVSFIGPVKDGTIRALFSTQRSVEMPTVPTAAEVGIPNFTVVAQQGIWATGGTPKDITQKLSSAVALATTAHEVVELARKVSIGLAPSAPETQLAQYEADIRFWQEAARISNFQPE